VRVVLLTHHYPRWPGDFRGASLGALARALVRRGVAVRVVTSGEETFTGELDGVPVRRLRLGLRLPDNLADQETFATRLRRPATWNALLEVSRVLRAAARKELADGADVLHTHCWLPGGLSVPAGVAHVLTVQGPEASLLRDSRVARWWARRALRRAAVVTATTPQAAEVVQQVAGRHLAPERVHPMPVDSRNLFWSRGGNGAVLSASLDREGRVGLALETVAVLASCGHDLALTVIGDGPERPALERQAQLLGVAALVRFLGSMPVDQARGHLAQADLMLLTARGDGSAVPALEALITGVPVVACWDSGAVVDLVPESGAGRLSIPSAEALADSIISLQAEPARLAMARLVGEAWRARLAPDHVARLCERWYRDALAR
jgi:glycosyltransferase involved in cell wall biosynthesis